MDITLVASIFSGSLWQIISNTSTFGAIILISLLFMSVICWVIIFNKYRLFKKVESDFGKFIKKFKRSKQLSESLGHAKSSPSAPISKIFLTGYNELVELKELKNQGGMMQDKINAFTDSDFEIIEMSMERTLSEEITELEKRVIFLATTANSAPFMGLLGTVVGIMDSFWSIGERGSASLAVVAPGIAEALLATIVGLGAAIPAVIAFNWANNKLKVLNESSYNFIIDFITLVKKENIR